jgi:hypothetical protein
MSSWCVLVAASVGSVIRRRTVVRTANQRATTRAAVKRGHVRPVEEEATVRKYKRSMVQTEYKDRNSGDTYVRTECGGGGGGGVKQWRWQNIAGQRGVLHVFCVVILTVRA